MNDREEWRERVRDIRATSATWWWWWRLIWSNSWLHLRNCFLCVVCKNHKMTSLKHLHRKSNPHFVVSTLIFFLYLSSWPDSLVFYLGHLEMVLGLFWSLCPLLFLLIDTKNLFDFQHLYSPKFPPQLHGWRNSHFRHCFIWSLAYQHSFKNS